MKISISNHKKEKRGQPPLEKRFEKLHKQFDRQKKLNLQFEKDLGKLTETYQRTIRETDQKQLHTLIALSKKLITFASRKSLSDWHRDELLAWMQDLITHRIAPLDPKMADQLQTSYDESIAKIFGMNLDEYKAHLQEMFDIENEGDEFFTDFDEESDDSDDDLFQEDLFGFDDEFEFNTESHEANEETFVPPESGPMITDKAWVKSLFRKTAQKLHPDREPDTEIREQKQKLLTELLAARKSNDVLTIIKIYSETFNEVELQLDKKELAAICELLEKQLEELKLEQLSHVHAHPERALVYHLLYQTSKKKRDQALKCWREELHEESMQNLELVKYLKNLSNLKEVLKERQLRHQEIYDWMLDDIRF